MSFQIERFLTGLADIVLRIQYSRTFSPTKDWDRQCCACAERRGVEKVYSERQEVGRYLLDMHDVDNDADPNLFI